MEVVPPVASSVSVLVTLVALGSVRGDCEYSCEKASSSSGMYSPVGTLLCTLSEMLTKLVLDELDASKRSGVSLAADSDGSSMTKLLSVSSAKR